jgi:hypothetical protein
MCAASPKPKIYPFIKDDDHVITAYAEPAHGPGWSNTPIWVILADSSGKLREECIQPEDQTHEMLILYRISAQVHKSMTSAIKSAIKPCT